MRGICFKEQLVLSILAGTKTETRRLNDRYNENEVLYLKEPYYLNEHGIIDYKINSNHFFAPYRNKLFMPQKYARYFIKIETKRQVHLNDITIEECFNEGISIMNLWPIHRDGYFSSILYTNWLDNKLYNTPQEAFAALIDKINGKGTWNKNPIVTKYTFHLIR